MTDSRGKILRVGDCVHKVAHRRVVVKNRPNGRALLNPLSLYTVHAIEDGRVCLRKESRQRKHVVNGAELVKE